MCATSSTIIHSDSADASGLSPASHPTSSAIRRRLLSDLSAPSPPKQMKKKKPKKSPAKSPPAKLTPSKSPQKSSSPTKSSPSLSNSSLETKDPTESKDGSDAQIDFVVDAVAHHSSETSDLSSREIVIVAPSTDPSLLCDKTTMEVVPESSSVAPLILSAVETEGSGKTLVNMSELSSTAAQAIPSIDSETSTATNDEAANSETLLRPATGSSSETTAIGLSKITGEAELRDGGVKVQQQKILPHTSEVNENPMGSGAPEKNTSGSAPVDDGCARAKGVSKRLSKKGEGFTLPSGEACINIPNSVIEKNMKSWEPFVLGQFYSDPPSQGTLHNIVNGIWSKYYRDISVSKLEGFAFLFRIPNAATRHRVITQGLWQIEGQTMFVNKWEPGVIPAKPKLTSAPIWLELRNVPFQFFNEDGLERIAGLVGHPKFLHPTTANKTNLEVAKVFTVIDPRQPLPEAVNVQFDSEDISRVLVSSPWMPLVCGFCKEVGHITKRCPTAPKACSFCNSLSHASAKCP